MKKTGPIILLGAACSLQVHAQFAPAVPLVALGPPPALEAVDLDGDTDADLFGLADQQFFRWYANTDGAGDFSQLLDVLDMGTPIGRWKVANMDGDAFPDVVYLDAGETTAYLLTNLGNATFAAPVTIGTLPNVPFNMCLADITGEGLRDVIFIIDGGDGNVAWSANTGSGLGVITVLDFDIPGPGSSILLAGDVDLGGGTDLVVSNWNSTAFALRNIAGDATVWQADTLVHGTLYAYENSSALIDVDNDGDLDLAEAGTIALHWAENHIGEGGEWALFTDHTLEPWDSAGKGVFGHLGCNAATAVVFVPSFPVLPVTWTAWMNEFSDFSYRAEVVGVPRGTSLVLADFSGDGLDDLVLNHPEGTAWYPNLIAPPTTQVLLPQLDTLCMYGPEFPLPTAEPAGGRWEGFAVNDNIYYRSTLNGTGSYALRNTVYEAEGCPVGATTNIFITEQPAISPSITSPLCSNDDPLQMSSMPRATEWVGIGPDGVLDPSSFSNGTFVAIYTDATGETCATESNPVEVWTSLPASIEAAGPFCFNEGPQLITASAQPPFGVEWSGDITGWNSSGATFDPAMGAGAYSVVLYAEPSGPFQCAGTDTLVITVSDLIPSVTTSPLDPQCAEGSAIALVDHGLPLGGQWSGPGVVNDTLQPGLIGAGTHLLTYSYFDPGGCASSEVLEVELTDTATVNWIVDDLVLCEYDVPVVLTPSPGGGSWTAPIPTNGVVDPAALSAGSFPVQYTWTGANGCTLTSAEFTIQRWSTSTVIIDPVEALCDDDPATVINGAPPGQWSDMGSGFGPSTIVEPSVLGAGTYPVTLTAAYEGECPGSATLDLVVEVCMGTAEAEMAGLAVSPNPFQDFITVDLGSFTPTSVEVFDAAGRRVFQERQPASDRMVIDLRTVPPGAYLLRMSSPEDQGHSVRLIKL